MLRCANIVFIAGFVLCLAVSVDGFVDGRDLAARQLMLGVMTLMLLVLVKVDFGVLKHPVFLAYLVYWLWLTYSICFAVNKGESISRSFSMFNAMLIMLCLTTLLKKLNIAKVIILATICLGLYGIYEFSSKSIAVRVGIMDSKNLNAASIVLLMILCSYYYKEWKIPSLVAIGLSLFVIISLRARSSWLSLFAALIVFALSNRKYLIPSLCGLLLLGVIVCKGNDIYNTSSLGQRLEIWKQTAIMIKDYPAGVGAGNWKLIFPLYAKYSSSETRANINYKIGSNGENKLIGWAHNDFLQEWSEIGIFGFASYLLLFILALYYSRGAIRAGIAGYITMACFTFPSHRAYLWFLLIIFFALAMKDYKPALIKFKRVYTVGAIALLVLCVIGFTIKLQTSIKSVEVYRARNINWDRVISATDNLPFLANLDRAGMPLAYYRGVAFLTKKDLDNSLESFEYARKCSPNHIHILMNLSACYTINGEYRRAVECLHRVLTMCPDFIDAKHNLVTTIKMYKQEV